MQKKNLIFASAIFALALSYSAFIYAQEFTYPVPELGNCESQEACKAYCDDSSHLDECVQFGEKHNLLDKEELKKAKEFEGQTGPGGCQGANECRAYCEDSSHQNECLEFGQRKGLISDQNAEVTRRVRQEGGPGGCKDEKECRAYCEDPANLDQCFAFAETNGLISGEEASRLKKMALVSGPGGCRGNECRTYCEDPGHQQECIAFAEENGLMSKEEAERAKKFAGKTGPGGCRGEECRTFCENPENAESCLDFAAKEGLMPPQELERARKFIKVSQEGGPGGCKGGQCREFCADPANQNQCFEFAKKQGLINPAEEKQFEAGMKIREKLETTGGPGGCKNENDCRAYCADPDRVEECVAFGAAHGGIPETEAREMLKNFQEKRFELRQEFRPPEDFARFKEEAERRFEEFKQLEIQFRNRPELMGPPAGGEFPAGSGAESGQVGPGGCSSASECIKYCSEHKEECFSFGPAGKPDVLPPQGGIPPGQDGSAGRSDFPQLRQDAVQLRPRLEPRPKDLKIEPQLKKELEQRFPEEFERRSPENFSPSPENIQPPQMRTFPAPPEGFKPSDLPSVSPRPESFSPPADNFSRPPDNSFLPPPVSAPLPSGSFEQQFTPAPDSTGGEQAPPPPPPSSSLNSGFLASIIHFFVW